MPPQVNDAPALRLLRVSPRAVGLELEAAFAEMTFLHGYIHADPHPGNIMVRTKGGWLIRGQGVGREGCVHTGD